MIDTEPRGEASAMGAWAEIAKLRGATLKTLDQNRPFDVVSVSLESLIVRPHVNNKERPIRRDEIEPAYRALLTKGVLTRTEIHANYSEFNPAYVAAILAALPGVTHRTRPIELRYYPTAARG